MTRLGMFKDITGQRFGSLVAIKRVGSNKHKTSIWLFHCDCGGEKEISISNVLKGSSKSCGCYKKIKDITGEKFGKLTAIKFVKRNKGRALIWLWQCECGKQKEIRVHDVLNGKSKTCGCSKLGNKGAMTHGGTNTRLYRIWAGMKTRCNDVNQKDYPDYGGRGIQFCDKWCDFSVFKTWATENGYAEDLTIDRIDTNGNYEESNCKWSTITEQNRNRRNNVYVEISGETKLLVEWCAILNVKYSTASERNRRSGYYFREEEIELWKKSS